MFDQENDIAVMGICSEIIHTENKLAIMYELLSAAFWAAGQINIRISSVLKVWHTPPFVSQNMDFLKSNYLTGKVHGLLKPALWCSFSIEQFN